MYIIAIYKLHYILVDENACVFVSDSFSVNLISNVLTHLSKYYYGGGVRGSNHKNHKENLVLWSVFSVFCKGQRKLGHYILIL